MIKIISENFDEQDTKSKTGDEKKYPHFSKTKEKYFCMNHWQMLVNKIPIKKFISIGKYTR